MIWIKSVSLPNVTGSRSMVPRQDSCLSSTSIHTPSASSIGAIYCRKVVFFAQMLNCNNRSGQSTWYLWSDIGGDWAAFLQRELFILLANVDVTVLRNDQESLWNCYSSLLSNDWRLGRSRFMTKCNRLFTQRSNNKAWLFSFGKALNRR